MSQGQGQGQGYGRVCERHGQWCPDGVCPYCPAAEPEPLDPYVPPAVHVPSIWAGLGMAPAALQHEQAERVAFLADCDRTYAEGRASMAWGCTLGEARERLARGERP